MTLTRGKRGIDCHLRYFTEAFLLLGGDGWVRVSQPEWEIRLGDAKPSEGYAGATVKHVETGHVWRLTGESDKWGHQRIFLGSWAD